MNFERQKLKFSLLLCIQTSDGFLQVPPPGSGDLVAVAAGGCAHRPDISAHAQKLLLTPVSTRPRTNW